MISNSQFKLEFREFSPLSSPLGKLCQDSTETGWYHAYRSGGIGMGEIVILQEYRKRRKSDQKHQEARGSSAVQSSTKRDMKQQALEKEKAEQVCITSCIDHETEEPA